MTTYRGSKPLTRQPPRTTSPRRAASKVAGLGRPILRGTRRMCRGPAMGPCKGPYTSTGRNGAAMAMEHSVKATARILRLRRAIAHKSNPSRANKGPASRREPKHMSIARTVSTETKVRTHGLSQNESLSVSGAWMISLVRMSAMMVSLSAGPRTLQLT